jgi:hypothetical protein
MRLTIIVSDGSVYKNGVPYNRLDFSDCNIPVDVHALQWQESSGWIEFIDNRENEQITQLPVWADACVAKWDKKDYEQKHPPAPTPEEIINENKSKAKDLLFVSDWTQLPDVPLANKEEWEVYRSALREIVINSILNPVWPVEPPVIWS